MKALPMATVLILLSTLANAETVQTTDGRTIELNEDGTFAFIERAPLSDSLYVEHQSHYFVHHEAEFGRQRIRFMPVFLNISEKRIMGTKFTALFLSPFGEEVFKFSGETDEVVAPGATSSSNLFYYFEDNQFIGGEPYDKLLTMVRNNSGSIEVTLDKIAFEGGEVVDLSD